MRTTITISLSEDFKRELDEIIAAEGVSRSEIVRESLRKYLFILRFRRLRERMMAAAQGKGIHTDRDVFEEVS